MTYVGYVGEQVTTSDSGTEKPKDMEKNETYNILLLLPGLKVEIMANVKELHEFAGVV